MSKAVSSFELSLNHRPLDQSLTNWLYSELRAAILEGRLKAGAKLPASRDFARRYHVSRGTVVSAFERLQDEGYLSSHVGIGTWVSAKIFASESGLRDFTEPPRYVRRAVTAYRTPKPFENWVTLDGVRPFRMSDPALAEFPIAHYLGSSRGVNCSADQIVITSGVQQALDLLTRLLLKPGDAVWMEDPGYFGASIAFERVGARIIPVLVDEEGLSVSAGIKACATAKGVYLTPAHQYPLGMTMSLERRIEVLRWAARTGSFIIEDDYDSEYRFEGPPAPALQGLDRSSSVIFVGTFTKLLFPSLRLGYVILPPSLVDVFVSFRRGTDLRSSSFEQAVLSDFIVGGHFGRHLRRMRNLYSGRLQALMHYGRRYLAGVLDLADTTAGLYTAAFLQNGMTSRQAESIAAQHGLETRALDRFTLKRPDPKGLLLGFAAFDEKAIRAGVVQLATALSRRK